MEGTISEIRIFAGDFRTLSQVLPSGMNNALSRAPSWDTTAS